MGDYSKFIDEKRRAVPTPESMVDENGICAFGTFDKEFEKMDLVKLKNPTSLPNCFNRLKLTLWEATEVHLKNGVLLAVVCDMGIFGKTLNVFYDKRTKKVYCWDTNLKSKDTVIAPNLINGAVAEGKTPVSHVRYVNDFQDGKCHLKGQHTGKCLITVPQKDKTIVAAIKENNLTAELLRPAKGSVLHMIQLAKDTLPFSRADAAYYNGRVEHIFSEEGIQNTLAYVQAAAVVGLLATFNERFRQGVGITKIITLAEELPATIRNYKSGMTAFADELHKGKRTPDGYAQVFGRIFSGQPKLSLDDKSWQAFSNTTIQYVSAVRSAQDAPQLMRRMHYMSFVSMFRSDLYEGLCVGHAPRKCAVCGKWFLTTDARYAKYCDGLAPGDKRGRTCRQVGNLRGREQRELAADHPIKKIYTKRFNTITQYLGRGTLDEQTAAAMKALAKSKLEKALQDNDYAQGSYAAEMEQAALLAEAKAEMNR